MAMIDPSRLVDTARRLPLGIFLTLVQSEVICRKIKYLRYMGQCDGGFEVDACQFDGAGAGFGELKFAFDGRSGLDCLKGVCAVMRCYFLLYCQVDGAVDYFGDGVV
ncbi:hypothetical protein ACHAXS_011462 [Conticribra weissflogii]